MHKERYLYLAVFYDLMETVTIPKEEYEYLKRLEAIAQGELHLSLKRGLEDAAKGRLRER